MTAQTLSLHLTLDQPKPIPAAYRGRWRDLIKAVGKNDAPYLIFLGELLGLLDNDPAPQFACAGYSGVDMFGGRGQDWTLCTQRARIHREISQEISESWQRVEVEADVTQITGLPQDMYIEWDGDWIGKLDLTAGNIPSQLEPDILRVAQTLFAVVEHKRAAASKRGKLRAQLKREYRAVGTTATDGVAALDELAAALLDEDSDVGIAALERLKAMDHADPDVQAALITALERAHWIVREAAAEALCTLNEPRYLEALVCALNDKDGNVRAAAAEALGWRDDRAALPDLLPLSKDSASVVRRAAVAAVHKLAQPKAAPDVIAALIPLLQDEDRYVRSAAVSVLAEQQHPSLVEPFIECLKDWNDWIRQTAAYALGRWGDPRAVDGLTALLKDPEEAVRKEAKAALKKIGNKD